MEHATPRNQGDRKQPRASAARLSGRVGWWARVVWVLAALGFISLWAVGTYARLTGPRPECRVVVCDNIEFSARDVELMAELELPDFVNHRVWATLEVPYSMGFFLIAGLIFWRRPDHAVGLLVSIFLVYAGAMLFTGADDPLRRTYPALRPLVLLFDTFGVISTALVLYTFPDGRFVSTRSRYAAIGFLLLVISIPVLTGGSTRLQGPEVPALATALWLMLFVLTFGVGLRSQVYRYRNLSTPLQRQQTKWVLFGLAGQATVVVIWGTIGYLYPPSQPSPERLRAVLFGTPVILSISALVPITVAFAILRYRLFDIDRLINRALVYGMLTGALALVYFGGVIVLQTVFGGLGLEQSPLAIVLSTLAIAALFTPLRRRIQDFIDRRFYRRRYDLQITLAAFGMQLRDSFDLDSVQDELLGLTEEVLQPEHASLWIREARPVARLP